MPAQGAVDINGNECAAILTILGCGPREGALLPIDAIASHPALAGAITAAGGDYLPALEHYQPSLHGAVTRRFDGPAATAASVKSHT